MKFKKINIKIGLALSSVVLPVAVLASCADTNTGLSDQDKMNKITAKMVEVAISSQLQDKPDAKKTPPKKIAMSFVAKINNLSENNLSDVHISIIKIKSDVTNGFISLEAKISKNKLKSPSIFNNIVIGGYKGYAKYIAAQQKLMDGINSTMIEKAIMDAYKSYHFVDWTFLNNLLPLTTINGLKDVQITIGKWTEIMNHYPASKDIDNHVSIKNVQISKSGLTSSKLFNIALSTNYVKKYISDNFNNILKKEGNISALVKNLSYYKDILKVANSGGGRAAPLGYLDSKYGSSSANVSATNNNTFKITLYFGRFHDLNYGWLTYWHTQEYTVNI